MSDDPIKAALRMMPYGFYSITSKDGDDVNAMVGNWLTQVSFEPRMIAFGLQKTSYSYGLITNGGAFVVNLFHEDNSEALMDFTKGREKAPDKVEGVDWEPAPETGVPVLAEAAAYLEVKVTEVVDIGGDHDVVIGEVVGAGVRQKLEPEDTLSLPDLGWSYAG